MLRFNVYLINEHGMAVRERGTANILATDPDIETLVKFRIKLR